MTLQQARTELKLIRTYYNRISERKQRLAELRSSMGSIRVVKYGVRPTSGAINKNDYHLEEAIDRAQKLETEIANDIVTMAESRQRLVEKVERLPEPYSTVLTKRYVHLDGFEKIALNMNYSCERIRHITSEGVKKYANLQLDTN